MTRTSFTDILIQIRKAFSQAPPEADQAKMDDFPNLPLAPPKQALEIISASSFSRAQKLLAASLVTQSRSFNYELEGQDLLILDVTHFLNHRINTRLMEAIGEELAYAISIFDPDLILTAPSSGNIPAIATALKLPKKPDVIYAPKGMPITMEEGKVYQAQSRSYTHGKSVFLTVANDCLPKGAKVAICDDFLDTGKTGVDLNTIVLQAQAQTKCFFFLIEKPFGGRALLKKEGFADEQIISLITIESMRSGKLKLAGFNYWFELARK